jgi:threonine dehydratase
VLPANWISNAEELLAGKINETAVTFDSKLNAYIKWENKQRTGSFKIRGALNKILQLTPEEIRHGLVTVSTGNHGQAAALAASFIGAHLKVYLPAASEKEKQDAVRAFGAEVCLVEGCYRQAEEAAMACARNETRIWISPYNDGLVIAGHGTLGAELIRQVDLDQVDQILIPIGGGGLAAGIGAALDRLAHRPAILGVQAEASPYFYSEYKTHSQEKVLENNTLAEGLAGAIEKGSITIPLVQHYLNDILLVSEAEIGAAIKYAWETWNEKLEGSGAVPLAAVLSGKTNGKKSLLIFSGGNIDGAVFASLCEK